VRTKVIATKHTGAPRRKGDEGWQRGRKETLGGVNLSISRQKALLDATPKKYGVKQQGDVA